MAPEVIAGSVCVRFRRNEDVIICRSKDETEARPESPIPQIVEALEMILAELALESIALLVSEERTIEIVFDGRQTTGRSRF